MPQSEMLTCCLEFIQSYVGGLTLFECQEAWIVSSKVLDVISPTRSIKMLT